MFQKDGITKINLLSQLKKHGQLDINVLLGQRCKVGVRLVAVRIPEDVAQMRRRKLRQNSNRRMSPTKDHLALLGWEIFLTNVDDKIWTAQMVCDVYGLRWRIEIIFKAWKSHFKMNGLPLRGSKNQIKVIVFARLIFIVLFQNLFWNPWRGYIHKTTDRKLSLLKLASFITQHFWSIINLLSQGNNYPFLEQMVVKYCTYEKRRRPNYEQIVSNIGLRVNLYGSLS